MEGLTVRQKKFCDEYLKNGNATQSYIKAGYSASEDVAAVNSHKLLRNTKIKTYIAQKQEKIEDESIMSIQEAQKFLTDIAKNKTDRTNDKLKAVELLMKMQGAFLDRLNVNAEVKMDYENKLKELQENSEYWYGN